MKRSSNLLQRSESCLLVIDMQERLLPGVLDSSVVQWNVSRLVRAAHALDVSYAVSEQYPEKLGSTVGSVAELLQHSSPIGKRMFSCRQCVATLLAEAAHRPRESTNPFRQLVVCGIETHVCVQQTVLDLLDEFQVHVVVDAVTARASLDHRTALSRMQSAGATLTTTESVLFEWCETSLDANFKTISGLVRESPPSQAS